MRQQLREWCCEAVAKRGDQRQPLAVEAGVAPLLRWVWHWWQGPQLTLALEASTLGDRFVVLAISMHYRGCALPVAWAVLPATATGAWKAEWGRPLQHLQATVPDVTAVLGAPRRQRRAPRLRLVSVLRRGWSAILVALLRHEPPPPGRLIPEPWPVPPDPLVGAADHAI